MQRFYKTPLEEWKEDPLKTTPLLILMTKLDLIGAIFVIFLIIALLLGISNPIVIWAGIFGFVFEAIENGLLVYEVVVRRRRKKNK